MKVWLLLPLVAWLPACGGAPFEDVIPGAEAGSGEAVQEPEAGVDAMNHPDAPAGAQDGAAGHEADAPEAGQSEGSAASEGGPSEAGVACRGRAGLRPHDLPDRVLLGGCLRDKRDAARLWRIGPRVR